MQQETGERSVTTVLYNTGGGQQFQILKTVANSFK